MFTKFKTMDFIFFLNKPKAYFVNNKAWLKPQNVNML